MTEEKMLTPCEVGAMLAVSEDVIYAHIASGELTATDVSRGTTPRWRISRADLDAFLRRRASTQISPPATAATNR